LAKHDPNNLESYVQQVATHRGWVVNPDSGLTQPIVAGLSKNSSVWGRPFCPCRDVEGDIESNGDIVCPCRYAAADIQEFGQCYCGLFLRPGTDPETVASIPERRADHE